MNILKYVERFFPKLFIGIWLNNGRYYLTFKKVLPSGKTSIENSSFDKDEELESLFKTLSQAQTDNILTYIAILDDSDFQGAIPVTNTNEYLWFPEISEYKEFDDIVFKKDQNGWSIFTLSTELFHTQNKFKKSGLDFIFSPFLIPIVVQKKFKLPKSTSIFIFAEKNKTIFTIFKGDKLLFGRYIRNIDMNNIHIEDLQGEIEKNGILPFDNLSSDIDDSAKFKNQSDSTFFNEDEVALDDFIDGFDNNDSKDHFEDAFKSSKHNEDDLLDLDLLLELDDKIEPVEDIDLTKNSDQQQVQYSQREDIAELEKFLDKGLEDEIKAEKKILDEFSIDDNLVYQAISTSVETFYGNNVFESDFIENCYILTSLKVSNKFIQKIEDEFSFETEKIRVEMSELVVDLIGVELE